MSRHKFLMLSVAVISVGLLGTSALAEVINPVDASESSYYSNGYSQPALNLINVASPDGVIKVTKPDENDPSTWYIHDFSGQGWMSNGGVVADQWVVFDLGASYDLDKIDIWNYYQGNNDNTKDRSTKDFEVWSASDMSGMGTITTKLYEGTLSRGVPAPEYYEQFALTGATDVRYVLINVKTNYPLGGNYVGLGFVTFEPIPEPGTLALLATGLIGLLCYAWRKRK